MAIKPSELKASIDSSLNDTVTKLEVFVDEKLSSTDTAHMSNICIVNVESVKHLLTRDSVKKELKKRYISAGWKDLVIKENPDEYANYHLDLILYK